MRKINAVVLPVLVFLLVFYFVSCKKNTSPSGPSGTATITRTVTVSPTISATCTVTSTPRPMASVEISGAFGSGPDFANVYYAGLPEPGAVVILDDLDDALPAVYLTEQSTGYYSTSALVYTLNHNYRMTVYIDGIPNTAEAGAPGGITITDKYNVSWAYPGIQNRVDVYREPGDVQVYSKWLDNTAYSHVISPDPYTQNGDYKISISCINNLYEYQGAFYGTSGTSAFQLYQIAAATVVISTFSPTPTEAITPINTPTPIAMPPDNYKYQWGTLGSGDNNFNNPIGLCLASGNVVVADWWNHKIKIFDKSGTFISSFGANGSGTGQFGWLTGVAWNGSYLYVLDGNNYVQKYQLDGTYVTQWGGSGPGDGQFNGPYGICADNSGNILVADWMNHRIQKFDANGVFLSKIGSPGAGDGEFNRPMGVAVDANGYIYTTEQINARVQKFTPGGTFMAKWGSSGSGPGQFSTPTYIAIGPTGAVFVSDQNNNRVQVFDSQGVFLGQWGAAGAGNGGFNNPEGIAVDGTGLIFVSDMGNNRVQVFGN